MVALSPSDTRAGEIRRSKGGAGRRASVDVGAMLSAMATRAMRAALPTRGRPPPSGEQEDEGRGDAGDDEADPQ